MEMLPPVTTWISILLCVSLLTWEPPLEKYISSADDEGEHDDDHDGHDDSENSYGHDVEDDHDVDDEHVDVDDDDDDHDHDHYASDVDVDIADDAKVSLFELFQFPPRKCLKSDDSRWASQMPGTLFMNLSGYLSTYLSICRI